MQVLAGKDKIILKDVETLVKSSKAFETAGSNDNLIGVVHSVPEDLKSVYKVGTKVLLRSRVVPETVEIEGVTYTFVQSIDIIARFN